METENQPEIEIFEIPEHNMEELNRRIAKLNKRAVKIECEPLQIIIHGVEEVPDPIKLRELTHSAFYRSSLDCVKKELKSGIPLTSLFSISIKGQGPHLAGWKFIGTLDHMSLAPKVIVNTVPGESIPAQFHDSEAICDHCNKIRTRKETFVVENTDTNEMMQVGRQCIKDFLGHNPSRTASFLQSIYALMQELRDGNDDSFGSWGGQVMEKYELVRLLTITSATIRKFGWVPRSSADVETGRFATAGEACYAYEPPYRGTAKDFAAWKQYVDALEINDEDATEATSAIAWLAEQEASNEYMHNIKAIGEVETFARKLSGYACSIVSAYQRAEEKLRVQKMEKKNNAWVDANVKDKVEFDVRIIGTRVIDGYYGTTRLYRMLDSEGRTLTWFSSGDCDMRTNGLYKIKGTIKKFDEYNEWKQTVLTRVKVLEELEDKKEVIAA